MTFLGKIVYNSLRISGTLEKKVLAWGLNYDKGSSSLLERDPGTDSSRR